MTYEERKQQVCDSCNKNNCGYKCRALIDKCEYVQSVMEGWELGQQDTIGSLWKDAQGDDLPEINREVIALQESFRGAFKVVFAHRPNPKGWDGKSLSTGEVEHYIPMIYDKGGWSMEGITYWLDAPLPEGIE